MSSTDSNSSALLRRVTIGIVLIGALGAAAAALSGSMNNQTEGEYLTHRVSKGDLSVTVTEQGTLESSSNIEIKCKVKGGSTVLWVIET
ncbi:MAG: hypothetical protein AAF483_18790, partial [Planctomycetota bacterium]